MKKSVLTKVVGALVLAGTVATLGACGKNSTPENWKVDNSGKTFNIYCWNDEYRVFFHKYLSDESKTKEITKTEAQAKSGFHLDGVPVVWVETPSSDGQYQTALDNALRNQATAKADDKVDMFLAEADYIVKYANNKSTQDIKTLGVTNMAQTYEYTRQAASDSDGVVKGVSFQCCPSALIYNRTIAKAVFKTDDPAVIQTKVSDWSKFSETAKTMKESGYLMTACEAETFRVFSNNASSAWVDAKGNLTIPQIIHDWMTQAEDFVAKEYTQTSDVWAKKKVCSILDKPNYDALKQGWINSWKKDNPDKGEPTDADLGIDGYDPTAVKSAFCVFGPAWYYNFCMGDSKKGDWAICEGPMAHFWGGTWLMAAAGSDNTDLVAKTMNAFINDEALLTKLVTKEGQFTNNMALNKKMADAGVQNEFLGGQNDTAIFVELAKKIQFKNATNFDQLCNEGLQKYFREYLDAKGTKNAITKEQALNNFYAYIKTKYAGLKTPMDK